MFSNPKFLGLVNLFVKANFIIAGIALFKMPTVALLFFSIPLYQVVAVVIFLVLIEMELKPYFAAKTARKSKKKSEVEAAGLDYIATEA